MSDYYTETCPCPVCSLENKVKRLISTEGYVAVDLDYRVYSRGADPTRLLLTRCPGCGFTEYVTDFKKPIDQPVREELVSEEYQALLLMQRASDFPLVARIKIAKNEPQERIAYCYLRSSWFSGDQGLEQEEARFLEMSCNFFEAAIIREQGLTPQERDRIYYLLGEIWRRLGHFKQALYCLNQIRGESFSQLIRDQRNLIAGRSQKRRRIKER